MVNDMSKRQKEYCLYISLIVLIAFLVFFFSFKDNGVVILATLQQLDFKLFLVAVCAILLYHIIVGYILRLFAQFYKENYSMKEGLQNALIAALFHGITPFASGGQFIQGYVFYKQGVDVGESASILLMDFIVYQITMVFYTLIFIVLKYTTYFKINSSLFTIALLGFAINFVVIIGLLLLAHSYKLHSWLCSKGIYFLAKWKLIKNPEASIKQFNEYLSKFKVELARLSNKKSLIFKVVLANILRLTLYFVIPYLCALALQVEIPFSYVMDVIALSSFVSMVNSFIPLPGASGGSEGAFTIMFSGLMSRANVISTMLLWRFITYYMILMIGALMFVRFNKAKPIREIEEELYENRLCRQPQFR